MIAAALALQVSAASIASKITLQGSDEATKGQGKGDCLEEALASAPEPAKLRSSSMHPSALPVSLSVASRLGPEKTARTRQASGLVAMTATSSYLCFVKMQITSSGDLLPATLPISAQLARIPSDRALWSSERSAAVLQAIAKIDSSVHG